MNSVLATLNALTIKHLSISLSAVSFILLTLALSSPVTAQGSANDDPTLREYEGVVEPVERFVFSARFDGILQSLNFIPGQIVKKGDLVLEFSPKAKAFGVERAQAQRERAEAELRGATLAVKKLRDLLEKSAVPTNRVLEAEIDRDIAAAKLKESTADEKIANLILENMQLRAPFTGIMSRPYEAVGTFIDLQARTQRPLAEIVKLDPIWVVAKVPYNIYYERRTAVESDEASLKRSTYTLVLPNGEVYPHRGRLRQGSYQIDQDSQTMDVWAEFPNPDFLLRPGLKLTVQSRRPKGK